MNRDYYDTAERQRYNKEYYESHKQLKGRYRKEVASEYSRMRKEMNYLYDDSDNKETTSRDGALHIMPIKRDPHDGGGEDFTTKDGTKYKYVGGRWVIDRGSLNKTLFKWAKEAVEKRMRGRY